MRLSAELAWICDWLSALARLPRNPVCRSACSRAINPRRVRTLLEENQLVPLWISSGGCPPAEWSSEWQMNPVEWQQSYFQSGRQAALRQVVLQQISRAVAGKADVVILKGMALTPALYLEAAARPMRDIDLLCAPDEKEKVRDILVDAGFRIGPGDFIHHHLPPVFDPAGRVSIELHDNLLTPPLPADCMTALWARREACSLLPGLFRLDSVAAWFHHALHAVSDPVDSPFLRDLFEVAWMANGLTEPQRRDVMSLAEQSGRRNPVFRAGNMAADVFGGERWAQLSVSPYERWCFRRLEWVRPQSHHQRLMQHAGRHRFNRLCEFPDERNPFPWLWQWGRSILERCFQGVRHRFRSIERQTFQCPDYPFIQVDGNILIRNTDTRAVHMLNELSAAVWLAAIEPRTWAALNATPVVEGSELQREQAIRVLIENGLLQPIESRSTAFYSSSQSIKFNT